MTHVTPQYLRGQGLSETFPERFWAKVRKTEGCWIWTGSGASNGYGKIWTGLRPNRARPQILAHRASWLLHFGPIADCVLHHCDNPLCVRPEHLFVGDRKDNNDDKMKKGRYGGRVGLGEDHPMAVLTADRVAAIIQERRVQGTMLKDLAAKHGVCLKQIWRIVNGIAWKRRSGFKLVHQKTGM